MGGKHGAAFDTGWIRSTGSPAWFSGWTRWPGFTRWTGFAEWIGATGFAVGFSAKARRSAKTREYDLLCDFALNPHRRCQVAKPVTGACASPLSSQGGAKGVDTAGFLPHNGVNHPMGGVAIWKNRGVRRTDVAPIRNVCPSQSTIRNSAPSRVGRVWAGRRDRRSMMKPRPMHHYVRFDRLAPSLRSQEQAFRPGF